MSQSRTVSRWALMVLAFAWVTGVLVSNAFAAGSITYKKKEVTESGGWHLAMTILYGSVPATPHQVMKFSFAPTAFYERYLDDQHGETPQMRKIPLVGQVPIIESVDVDFSDARGKVYNKTLFDFTITRSHNFSAGEYSVTVRRGDGAQIGAAQTLILLGDNPVIDRRAISFVANGKDKDKDKKKADAPAPASSTDSKSAPAAEDKAESGAPAASAASSEQPAPDSANAEKVPPSHGCGCRVAGEPVPGVWRTAPLFGLFLLGLRKRRARA